MPLSGEQVERYSRQIILPEIGGRGQERLLASSVGVIGTGPVVWMATSYLAGAGVGHIDIHSGPDESPDAASELRDDLADLNPDVKLAIGSLPDHSDISPAWLGRYDLALCVTDSRTLAVVGTAAAAAQRPIAAAGLRGDAGWLCVIAQPPEDGCATCTERHAIDASRGQEEGPFAAVSAGVIGSLLAVEASKLLLGMSPVDGWFLYDAPMGIWTQYPREGCRSPASGHGGGGS